MVQSDKLVSVAAIICLSAQKFSKLICYISEGDRAILLKSLANSTHLLESSGSPRSEERKFLSDAYTCVLLNYVSSRFQKLDWLIIKLQFKLPDPQFIIQMARINLPALLIILYLAVAMHGAVCTISNAPSLTIGNFAGVCLTVTYTSNTTQANSSYYYVFKIKVDQFTSLKLNGVSTLLKNNTATVATLSMQFQGQTDSTDFIILDIRNNTSIQRSVISTVINTIDGTFTSISNDLFCDSTCGNCLRGECFDNFNSYSSPDLKVYISWAGSDASKNNYLSQAQRLSRFSLYSVSSIYSSVKNVY